MTIVRSTLPNDSLLNRADIKYDYIDSFQGLIIDRQNKLDATDIGKAFFSSSPRWVNKLFSLRNKIVALFALKIPKQMGSKRKLPDNFKCEKGEQVRLFKIIDKTGNEIILGEDDKHLNFRVSLYLGKGNIGQVERKLTISTCVTINNWFGRVYFLPVRPFHKLIVPAMLKGIVRQLERADFE